MRLEGYFCGEVVDFHDVNAVGEAAAVEGERVGSRCADYGSSVEGDDAHAAIVRKIAEHDVSRGRCYDDCRLLRHRHAAVGDEVDAFDGVDFVCRWLVA